MQRPVVAFAAHFGILKLSILLLTLSVSAAESRVLQCCHTGEETADKTRWW